jgi:hypothetical protein
MMFCTECGFKNLAEAKFCQNCGVKTSVEASAAASQNQPQPLRTTAFIPPPPMRAPSRPNPATEAPLQATVPPMAPPALPACEGDSRKWHNCLGTMEYPDGSKYVGEYKDGTWNGMGTYTGSTGWHYEGEFRDGQYNGQGTYTDPDGKIQSGQWRNDRFIEVKPKQDSQLPKTGWPFT